MKPTPYQKCVVFFAALSLLFSPVLFVSSASPDEPNQSAQSLVLHPHKETRTLIDERGEQKVIMVSYVFGASAIRKKYLRMFIETAATSGIDYAVVGDNPPPFHLPPNVRHVPITWNQFVDRVYDRVFDGNETGDLREAIPYKACEFKPLFAYLFPEEVQGYDWWGHIDNDLLVGNFRKFLTPDVLEQNDIISGIHMKSWGPFTLYRNNHQINELFRLLDIPLEDIFASKYFQFFDEWGGGLDDYPNENSMTGIISKHSERLGLRWHGEAGPYEWDGHCPHLSDAKHCAECLYKDGRLFAGRGSERNSCTEVLLCHMQFSKPNMEGSLEDPDKMKFLLEAGIFRVSHPEGFDYFTNQTCASGDTNRRLRGIF
jgi:hypothetical protein